MCNRSNLRDLWGNRPRTACLACLLLVAGAPPVAGQIAAHKPPAESAGGLNFDLPDVFGRQVRSGDYAGQVVLAAFGAAWCGGCQQDACDLPQVIARYAPKGLQVLHVMAGDSELNGLEFQRHYRLSIVHLLDANRQFEKQYNKDGWPFTALFGPDGRLLYQANDSLSRIADDLAPRIEKALAQVTAKVQPVVSDGLPYMPATIKRSREQQTTRAYERYPSIACGPDGRIYLAFTSNRKGNSDVFMRVYDGKAWSPDSPIAATPADEFDATVLVDRAGKVWLAWTSNAAGTKYNIFAATLDGAGKLTPPQQLTDSDDDAMHARLVCDATGRVWVTYYKWAMMGEYSRDREIYVRRHDGKGWSGEVHVSPEDVPDYEDHDEPVAIPWADGVAVAWSWDFHQPKGYPANLQDPTIFVRTIGPDLGLGGIVAIGDENIDEAPTIAQASAGLTWCAWAASVWQNGLRAERKILLVRSSDLKSMRPGADATQIGGICSNLCTPCLASGPDNALTLLWSEQVAVNGPWQLKRADCRAGRWSAPQTVEAKGDPRFPAAAHDRQGRLWVAFTQDTDGGRQVVCRQLSAAAAQSGPARATGD